MDSIKINLKLVIVFLVINLINNYECFSQNEWISEVLKLEAVITDGSDSNAIYLQKVYDVSPDSSIVIVGSNPDSTARVYNSKKVVVKQIPFRGSGVSISNDLRVAVIIHFTTENGFYRTRVKCYDVNRILKKDTIVQGHGAARFINNGELFIAHNSEVWGFNLTNPATVLLILDDQFELKLKKQISKNFRLQMKPYFDFKKSEYVFPEKVMEGDSKKIKLRRFNIEMESVE